MLLIVFQPSLTFSSHDIACWRCIIDYFQKVFLRNLVGQPSWMCIMNLKICLYYPQNHFFNLCPHFHVRDCGWLQSWLKWQSDMTCPSLTTLYFDFVVILSRCFVRVAHVTFWTLVSVSHEMFSSLMRCLWSCL